MGLRCQGGVGAMGVVTLVFFLLQCCILMEGFKLSLAVQGLKLPLYQTTAFLRTASELCDHGWRGLREW